MMETMRSLLGGLTGDATLPMRLGGLGLRSASRMSHSAYWASWADSLQMIAQRLPTVAVVANLADDQEGIGCLAELEEATRRLDHEGFGSRPERRCSPLKLASGSTAGSNTHLPLPNIITGRAWFLVSCLPRTRHICAPTQDQALVPSCWAARPVVTSRYNPRRFGYWLWRDCAFRSTSQTPCANAVRQWTIWVVIGERAPIQVV